MRVVCPPMTLQLLVHDEQPRITTRHTHDSSAYLPRSHRPQALPSRIQPTPNVAPSPEAPTDNCPAQDMIEGERQESPTPHVDHPSHTPSRTAPTTVHQPTPPTSHSSSSPPPPHEQRGTGTTATHTKHTTEPLALPPHSPHPHTTTLTHRSLHLRSPTPFPPLPPQPHCKLRTSRHHHHHQHTQQRTTPAPTTVAYDSSEWCPSLPFEPGGAYPPVGGRYSSAALFSNVENASDPPPFGPLVDEPKPPPPPRLPPVPGTK